MGTFSTVTFALLASRVRAEPLSPAANSPAPTLAGSATTGTFDWMRFSGTRIRLLADPHPWTESIRAQLEDFERLTGITVILESTLPVGDPSQGRVWTLHDADVVMSGPNPESVVSERGTGYEPLGRFVADRSLTAPEVHTGQLDHSANQLTRIPIENEPAMVFHAERRLDQREPGIYDRSSQLVGLAKRLHEPSGGGSFLYRYGENTSGNRTSCELSQQTGDRAELYPSGSANEVSHQGVALFQQGEQAMFVHSSALNADVAQLGVVTVAEWPDDASLGRSYPPGWPTAYVYGLAITSLSERKEAAWYFIQWATGKAWNGPLLQKAQCGDGGPR